MSIGNMSMKEIQKRAQELAQYAYEGESELEVAKQGVHLNSLLLSTLIDEAVSLKNEIKELRNK